MLPCHLGRVGRDPTEALGDQKPDGVETLGHGDPGVAARQNRELMLEEGEESGMRRDAVYKVEVARKGEAQRPEDKSDNRKAYEGADIEERQGGGTQEVLRGTW